MPGPQRVARVLRGIKFGPLCQFLDHSRHVDAAQIWLLKLYSNSSPSVNNPACFLGMGKPVWAVIPVFRC